MSYNEKDITHKCQECGGFFKGKKCVCGWELQGDIQMIAPCWTCGEPAVRPAFDGERFYDSSKMSSKKEHRFCYYHLQTAWADAYKPNVTAEQVKAFKESLKQAPNLSTAIGG